MLSLNRIGVRLIVRLAQWFGDEAFVAQIAFVWFQTEMSIFVIDKSLFRLERNITHRTFERLGRVVRFLVYR